MNMKMGSNVNRMALGIAAAGFAALALAAPVAGQERPRVSSSESSRASGPTCVIGATATDCDGGGIVGPLGPVLLGAPAIPGPLPSVPFGLDAVGAVSSDADVDRSTRPGTATVR
jgi:hypothetical protein